MIILQKMLDELFPPRCALCEGFVAGQGQLCAACWPQIDFITEPFCAVCGMPFMYAVGKEALCMPCLDKKPKYAMARSVFAYDEASRKLVTDYKYHDQTRATPMFAEWLARAGREILDTAEGIVPVPLHPLRLIARRYNQSALLAAALASRTGIPLLPSALKRIRHTAHQAGLSRDARKQNVRGAFRVPPGKRRQVKGKHLVLIDDVLTTGATLEACTQALRKAGAKKISLLTLARTVKEDV